HLNLRPYIIINDFYDKCDNLVEFHCNTLLKVNHEARESAFRDQRYASIPVWNKNINIIVRPHLDVFLID
ncbi:hypothetical protein B0T17DRAFT_471294, partial [Bombardia bombarda]